MDQGKILKKITADELKNVQGVRVRLFVEDTVTALQALKDAGEAKICGSNQIMLTTSQPITQVMLTLAQAGVTVKNFTQAGDALEDYYLEIVRSAHSNGGNL